MKKRDEKTKQLLSRLTRLLKRRERKCLSVLDAVLKSMLAPVRQCDTLCTNQAHQGTCGSSPCRACGVTIGKVQQSAKRCAAGGGERKGRMAKSVKRPLIQWKARPPTSTQDRSVTQARPLGAVVWILHVVHGCCSVFGACLDTLLRQRRMIASTCFDAHG
jgi:Na+-translocating ferredoxin:NAD+ oxidoreductase RNF subunit RnfB